MQTFLPILFAYGRACFYFRHRLNKLLIAFCASCFINCSLLRRPQRIVSHRFPCHLSFIIRFSMHCKIFQLFLHCAKKVAALPPSPWSFQQLQCPKWPFRPLRRLVSPADWVFLVVGSLSDPSPLSTTSQHCQHVWSEIKFDVPVCNTSFLALFCWGL